MKIFVVLICMFIFSIAGIIVLENLPFLAKEHGLIENFQVIILFVSFISFSFSTYMYHMKNVSLVSSIICMAFIFREVSIRKLILVGEVAEYKNIIMYILIIAGVAAAFFFRDNLKKFFEMTYEESVTILNEMPDLKPLVVLFIFCMALSWVFDKNIFQVSNNTNYEEIAEVCGYIAILIGSLSYIKYLKNFGEDKGH